jgi:flagellar FliJ protein
MKPLTNVAGSRERTAARELGDYRRMLSAAESKLSELLTYREEYSRKLDSTAGGIDVQQMRDYRAFLTKLNDAIQHQQARVEKSRREYEHRRHLWFVARTKAMALGKVVERYQAQEKTSADRREQADSDERALQAHVQHKTEKQP